MSNIPEHVKIQLDRLIDKGLPADQIAFMMDLSDEYVRTAIRERQLNTTKKTTAGKAAE